jgi:ATP-binding cassette, subfamily B, bacterial MsbA
MQNHLVLYRRLLAYALPYKRRLIIGLVAGLMAGGSLVGVLRLLPNAFMAFDTQSKEASGLLAQLAQRFDLPLQDLHGGVSLPFLLLSVIALALTFGFKALATYVNRYYLRWVGARVVMDLRNAAFAKLNDQSLLYFGQSDVGQLISNLTNDTNAVENSVSNSIADLTRAPIELLAIVVTIIMTTAEHGTWELMTIIFLVMPLCCVPIILLAQRVKRFYRAALRRISELVTRMHENFTSVRVIKAFHTEAFENERFAQVNKQYFRQVLKSLRAELLMTPLMEVVAMLMVCCLLVYCHIHAINLPDIMPLLGAAILAYDPIKRLAKVNAELQRSLAAAERVFTILDTHTRLPELADPIKPTELRTEIIFEAVHFAYGADRQVLQDINMHIRKGQMVAVVGETGSGKSTMAGLLARFFDPTAGRILLDGVPLPDLEVASLRGLIGVVTQETILFNETIAFNIAYGSPGATREQVEAAARQANAHEFIASFPEGYERVVGEKGFVLSGGQRQRVAIARAILRNPQILILDEATSALDAKTEALVQEALNHLMQDRTVFAIAHRLSTVRQADCIFVLDQGRVVEQGSHDELMRAGGRYHRLCELSLS